MTLLIIDTSTERSLVAFAKDRELLFSQFFPIGLKSSYYLASAIASGFKKIKLKSSDLQGVAVTIGPGSFTGIRVGVAFAKGVAFARSLPLIGLCSLLGFISSKEGCFASLIDAHIGGAYLLIQERRGEEIKEITTPKLVLKKDLVPLLAECRQVVGPSFKRFSLSNTLESYPNPAHLAKKANQEFLKKNFSKDLKLLYLRETQNPV